MLNGDNMKYRVFFEAFIVALFIFGAGFFFGLILESSHNERIIRAYIDSETNLLDAQILGSLLVNSSDCDLAISKSIEFGDRLYADSVSLDKYSESNELSDFVNSEHKKYDLLRTLFWINTVKITENCGRNVHTLVYLYDYKDHSISSISDQKIFSLYLSSFKERYGNKVILIPIAKDMDIISLDLLLEKYNPEGTMVIMNEEHVIRDASSLSLLEELILED